MWDKVSRRIDRRNANNPTNVLTDIIDGSEYRKHCQSPDGILYRNHNLTTIFNTDGVALYKSSRIEIWPIYVAINEIPPGERYERSIFQLSL